MGGEIIILPSFGVEEGFNALCGFRQSKLDLLRQIKVHEVLGRIEIILAFIVYHPHLV